MYRLIIAAGFCLLAGIPAARADIKIVPATVCQPAKEAHAERLVYNLRGVRNRDRKRNAKVICPLLRDNLALDKVDTALQQVIVGARVTEATSLNCTFLVRRFDTATNQWSTELVKSRQAGPFAGVFEIFPLPPYGAQIATMVIQCVIPPGGEIDSFIWVEENPTDEPPPT